MLLLQNGDRINKKKIIKIEKFLTDKTLDILLFTSDIITRNVDNQTKNKVLRDNQNNGNKLIEILLTVNSHITKIENQNKIFNFLHNFFKNTNERINNKTNKLTTAYEYFKNNKNELDLNFTEQIKKFRGMFEDTWYLKNITEDEIQKNIQIIEKAFTEFSKIYRIYEQKLIL